MSTVTLKYEAAEEIETLAAGSSGARHGRAAPDRGHYFAAVYRQVLAHIVKKPLQLTQRKPLKRGESQEILESVHTGIATAFIG